MGGQLSQMLVFQFNVFLNNENSGLRLELTDLIDGQYSVEIVLANRRHVDSVSIKPTDRFYAICNEWFRQHGVHLQWNNTKSIAWAKD